MTTPTPEYSTLECAHAMDVAASDKAGERHPAAIIAASRILPAGQSLVVLKNNSDGKGNSYGTHENYLMDRSVPFSRIVQRAIPHFVSRQVFTGAGKVGSGRPPPWAWTSRPAHPAGPLRYEVGLETTLKRPIVNTRDEPHCDAQKYRRLHVILGDANLSEISTFLKVGTTALVLSMIEDDWFARAGDRDLTLADPVPSMRRVSYDLSLTRALEMVDGRTMTALEVQWEHLDLARKYAEDRKAWTRSAATRSAGTSCGAGSTCWAARRSDPMSLATTLDWVAKYRVINGYRERHGLTWRDPKLIAMDLQYYDVARPEKSLPAERVGMERLVTEQSRCWPAMSEPPTTTRAYFRGKCLQRWGSQVAAANWDSLVFDLGTDPLRRVQPMMEPLRGTAAHVDALLQGCNSPAELLARLGN